MGDVKLLPCPNPWCKPDSSKAFRAHSTDPKWRVYCECGLNGPWAETLALAIPAWNARPAPALTPKQAAADEMYEALAECLKDTFTASDGMSECGDLYAKMRYRAGIAALAKAGQP